MEARRMRVQELRDELGRRGLDTRGLKGELADRLQSALDSEGARRGEAAGAEGRCERERGSRCEGCRGTGGRFAGLSVRGLERAFAQGQGWL